MRPWWHLSFGGERRPVKFPHGKSISLPRRASTRLTLPPTGARPDLGQSRETVACPGAELIVRMALSGYDGLKKARSGMCNHIAAAALRHALAASARKTRSADRETR